MGKPNERGGVTRQEEIREGMEELIKHWIIKNYPIGKETFSDLVKRIQAFEDSQGIRLPDGSSLIEELDIP